MLGNVLLVLATSMDGFSAGVAYGFRGVKFPFWPRAIAAGVSVISLACAMLFSRLLKGIFPYSLARLGSSALLIVLGLWTLVRTGVNERLPDGDGRLWSWRVPALGLVVQILREPGQADLDASGSINRLEAVWLGSALSLDAFAIGFCANLGVNLPFYLPLVVGLTNWLFMSAGFSLGKLGRRERTVVSSLLPGLILVVLGLLRLM